MSSSAPNTPSAPAPVYPRAWHLKLAPWLACAVALAAIVHTTSNWDVWTSGRETQSTQNAFIKSEPAVLSARVGGYVRSLPVTDFQRVKAGDLIAEIESDEYAARVQAAEASLSKEQAVLENLDNEEAEQRATIDEAEALLRYSDAQLIQAQQEFDRSSQLVTSGSISRKAFEDAKTALASARASREAAAAALSFARTQLRTLAGQRAQRMANREAAAASLASQKLEWRSTRIVAPFDGTLGQRSIQIGSLVATGTQIVSIVPLARPYVLANYKETQLRNVRAGQAVEILVDAFPGLSFDGRVQEIAPMSGNETSLVPTDNSTGNFTKVVQRIPVRIELLPGQDGIDYLRPGMSAEVRIDTRPSTEKPSLRQRLSGSK